MVLIFADRMWSDQCESAYSVFEVDVATDRSWIRKNSVQTHRNSCESRYTDSESA